MSSTEEQPDPFITYMRMTELVIQSWRLLGSLVLDARIGVDLTHEEDIASSLAEYRIDLGEITCEPLEDLLTTHGVCYLPVDNIQAAPKIRRSLAKMKPGEAQTTLLEALLVDAFPQRPAIDNIHPINGRPDTYLLQTPQTRLIIRQKPLEKTTQLLHLSKITPKNNTENPEKTPKPEKEPENHPYERILLKKPIVTTTYEIMTLWH